MVELSKRAEAVRAGVAAKIFGKTPEEWALVKEDVINLARYAQSRRLFRTDDRIDEWAERYFLNPHPDSMRFFLKKGGKVIGFSGAYRRMAWSKEKGEHEPSPTQAKIDLVVVAHEEQGKRYIGILGDTMDDELKRRGFEQFWVHAREGYADAIERHYGERVVSSGLVIPGEKLLVVNL